MAPKILCHHRAKYGFVIFGKHKCEERMPVKDFIAKKAVCATCRGPEYEEAHNCRYYRIGTEKEYADQNNVTVTEYCFKIYEKKDPTKNRLGPEHNCGPGCFLNAYSPRKLITKQTPEKGTYGPKVPIGLKVWPVLASFILFIIFGLSKFAESSPSLTRYDGLISFLGSLGLFIFPFFVWRTQKWAFALYEALLFLSAFFWEPLLLIHSLRNNADLLAALASAGIFLNAIVIFSVLPSTRSVLVPKESVLRKTQHRRRTWSLALISIVAFIIGLNILNSVRKTGQSPVPSDLPKVSTPLKQEQNPPTEPFPPAKEPLKSDQPAAKAEDSAPKTSSQTQEQIIHYLLSQGRAYHEEGRFDEAINMFNRILQINRNHPEASRLKENSLKAKKMVEDLDKKK